MDISRFYEMYSKIGKGPVFVEAEGLTLGQIHALHRGEREQDGPIKLRQTEGKAWTDLLRTTIGSMVVSRHFINVLQANNFTGWKTHEVELKDNAGSIVEGYAWLSIIGKGSKPNYDLSIRFEKRIVPEGPLRTYLKGWHVGTDYWDESNIFVPDGTVVVVVTQEVRDALVKAKLSNVSFQCLADMEFPETDILEKR